MLWYDPTLTEEIFIGQGKAIRVEAPNGLDRLTYDIDDNRIEGFSDDAFLRAQPAWAGDRLWTVPVSAGEFPVGAEARLTGIDLRGYQDMRLVVTVGSPGGPAGAQLFWSLSLDGGAHLDRDPGDRSRHRRAAAGRDAGTGSPALLGDRRVEKASSQCRRQATGPAVSAAGTERSEMP